MRRTISLIAVGLFALSAALVCQPAWAQEKPAPGPGMQAMWKHLPNLTQEQKQKIEELHKAFIKDIQPLRNQLRSERFALMSLKTANNPDQKAINAKIDALAKLRADIEKKQVAHRLQIRSLLTDEQKAALEARGKFRFLRARGRRMLGKERPVPGWQPRMWHREPPEPGPED